MGKNIGPLRGEKLSLSRLLLVSSMVSCLGKLGTHCRARGACVCEGSPRTDSLSLTGHFLVTF